MGKLPASLFYWGDFVRDPNVRRCTHAEVGVWIRILCLMWDAETKGLLENNLTPWSDEEIAMAIGGNTAETVKAVTSLVTKGVASRNERGSLMNRRMYREEKERVDTRERVRKFRAKQSSNGKSNEIGNDDDTQCTESEYETEDSVLAIKSSKKEKKEIQWNDFNASTIYSAYPRKVGRSAAIKAINNAFNRLTSARGEGARRFNPPDAAAFLLAATEAFADSPAGKAGEFCPHPSTWFNASRYLDDPNEWQRGNNGGKLNGKTDRSVDTATKFVNEIENSPSAHRGELLPWSGSY